MQWHIANYEHLKDQYESVKHDVPDFYDLDELNAYIVQYNEAKDKYEDARKEYALIPVNHEHLEQ